MKKRSMTLHGPQLDALAIVFDQLETVFSMQEALLDEALRGQLRPESAIQLRTVTVTAKAQMATVAGMFGWHPPQVH